jgi:segregation and condensation protein B
VEKPLKLTSLIESLLFVADHAVTIESLATALETTSEDIEIALQTLHTEYEERGIRIQRKGDRLQLVSAPEAGPWIEQFLGLEISGKLSLASLETLSIIAYRQPVTRAQIEAIRGVNSDSVLRSLIRRGLIEEVGRVEAVGRPILYGTTFEFLEQFGLQSLQDLPAWHEFDQALQENDF